MRNNTLNAYYFLYIHFIYNVRDDYMFDQQNYINNYIKNSYESIKERLRKDNALLINKIESVDNVNQYVIDLILKNIY